MTQNDTLRIVLLVLLALLLFPVLMAVVVMPMMGAAGWSHMWGNGMWGGIGVWFAVMMVVSLLVVAGIGYVIYRGLVATTGQHTDSAMEELRRAYARGDISDEEFDRRREKLRENE